MTNRNNFLAKLFIIALVFCSSLAYSQQSGQGFNDLSEDLKPLRIGVKGGIPNIGTLNVEYLTPLLDDRVAVFADYMTLGLGDVEYSNFELGSNIYFNNTGRGLYAGVSYFSFNGDYIIRDVTFDDDSVGDGEGTFDFNTLNAKIGARIGRALYLRIEAGYGFGELPEYIEVQGESGQTSREDISEVAAYLGNGVPIFNLGIGFAFL